MNRKLATITLGAALVLGACGKKKEEAPAPAPTKPATTGSGSAGSAAAPAPAPAAAAADLPTETDFEDQAKKDIDEKNVDDKVKAIEADLGQ